MDFVFIFCPFKLLCKQNGTDLFVYSYIHQYPLPEQAIRGIPKGKAKEMLDNANPVRFPLRPSGESEDHTGGPRRLFAYFLIGEKV